jgi:membrane protein implicated in regulation of membrane protease activity
LNFMSWVWLAALVAFGVIEAATAGLVSIWFVGGAAAALISSLLGAGIWVQAAVFLAVSAAALALTRPLVRKYTAGKAVATNLDRVLGDIAKVTETIDNENSTGAVYVDGKTWTARSEDGSVIPAGTQVRVNRMEGVKLYVKICEKKAEVL